MSTPKMMSDEETLKVLNEAAEQYRDFSEIQSLNALTKICVVEDYSTRDMSHPLGLVWQGRGNGVLE